MRMHVRKAATFLVFGLPMQFLLGSCGGIDPVAPYQTVTDPAQLYTTLTLDYRAVNLSTSPAYNTLQLTATPRDARGVPMVGLPAPVFRLAAAGDASRVQVTADGLVTAGAAATGVKVIAELVIDGPVRHADTAYVNVTTNQTPPVLTNLSIHPIPPDSARRTLPAADLAISNVLILLGIANLRFNTWQLQAKAFDTAGQAISGLAVEYASLDPLVASVTSNSGVVKGRLPGQVRMVAQTMAYGVPKADTVLFTVTMPFSQGVTVNPGTNGAASFVPSEVKIPPYGLVFWFNRFGDSADVVFDKPVDFVQPPDTLCTTLLQKLGPATSCTTGDFVLPWVTPPDSVIGTVLFSAILNYYTTTQVRQFRVPGVYPYHSAKTGAVGRIVVVDSVAQPGL